MIVKNLTAKRVERVGGKVATQFNFSDDGTNFKMYVLNGVPVSVARAGGETYLAFRPDYIESFHKAGLTELTFNVPYDVWSKNPAYNLENKYNGVEDFDFEELMKDIMQYRVAIIETQEAFEAQTVEAGDLVEKLYSEAQAGRTFVEDWKKNFDWIGSSDYEVNMYRKYAKDILRQCEKAEKTASEVENSTISKTELYNLVKRQETANHVFVNKDGFYYEKLQESLEKVA